MANSPQFANAPIHKWCSISTANANRDGTGTIVDLWSAGERGTVIEKIKAKAEVTTTAGMVRILIHDGSDWALLHEMIVSAITVAADVKSWEEEITVNMKLPRGWKIGAAPHNAEAFKVHAWGGDL